MRYFKRHQGVMSAVVAIAGFAILGYMWKVLGDGGIYADEHGTSGYISLSDIALVVVGVALLIYAGALFLGSRGRS